MVLPELPDIIVLTRSMNTVLPGRTITDAKINQPKVLNMTAKDFISLITGRMILQSRQRGKWILVDLDDSLVLAFNLGMGGHIMLHTSEETPNPQKERVVLQLDDKKQLWIHFWWFGHVHLIKSKDIHDHKQIGKLGIEPLSDEFTKDCLSAILSGRRGRIKSYLLNQHLIAGIGNVYVQDILWRARLHPQRKANTLSDVDISLLHEAILITLQEGIRYSGGPKERDIWGNEGHYPEHYRVAYRTGKACPRCQSTIEQIRVGSTTSYICPQCQT
ncbi:MAG: Formamidopyrimidine-DNA glycosylase [Candidatus Thorarchaeota archaeon]|nr:MAG: Formamidopyrimidine-DNA glycosylase [Candidatus Thorarchaeota archaeon]